MSLVCLQLELLVVIYLTFIAGLTVPIQCRPVLP